MAFEALSLSYTLLRLTPISADPPDLNFQSVFVPRPYTLPGIPSAAIQPMLNLYSDLEALQITADRYATALHAGDLPNAELQGVALQKYLAAVINHTPQVAANLQNFSDAIKNANVPDQQFSRDDLLTFQQQLGLSGFPSLEIDFFNALGLSSEQISQLLNDVVGLTIPLDAAIPSLYGTFDLAATRMLELGQELASALVAKPINIDIEPWFKPNIIDRKFNWAPIPVAILSKPGFDAPKIIDQASLTFGHNGGENSLAFCSPLSIDVNGDKARDLVCFFYTGKAGFQCGDTEGILKGKTKDGMTIEGSDSVKIVPCK
jgi:hypothetical protein